MSNTKVKEDGADHAWSKTFSFTVEQKDLYELNESIRQKIVNELAEHYMNDYGDKIIEIVSPKAVARQIENHISKIFWKNQKDE